MVSCDSHLEGALDILLALHIRKISVIDISLAAEKLPEVDCDRRRSSVTPQVTQNLAKSIDTVDIQSLYYSCFGRVECRHHHTPEALLAGPQRHGKHSADRPYNPVERQLTGKKHAVKTVAAYHLRSHQYAYSQGQVI